MSFSLFCSTGSCSCASAADRYHFVSNRATPACSRQARLSPLMREALVFLLSCSPAIRCHYYSIESLLQHVGFSASVLLCVCMEMGGGGMYLCVCPNVCVCQEIGYTFKMANLYTITFHS